MILGLHGACRRQELHDLTMDKIEDKGNYFKIYLDKTKTGVKRTFAVADDFYPIIKQYIAARPSDCNLNNFFLNFHSGACTKQNIGINKIGAMPKEIATFLKLPEPEL